MIGCFCSSYKAYSVILLVIFKIFLVFGYDYESSPPCPVINNVTGAMKCCPSFVEDPISYPDKDCRTVYPIDYIKYLPEPWIPETIFEKARNSDVKYASPETFPSPSPQCCCKGKRELLLPGRAMSNEGEPVKVAQHILGFVQPLYALSCDTSRCLNAVGEIVTCSQKWGTKTMFTYDSYLDGYVLQKIIHVPTGCVCDAKHIISQSSNNSSSDVLSDQKDVILDFAISNDTALDSEDDVSLDWSMSSESTDVPDDPDNFPKNSNVYQDIENSQGVRESLDASKSEDLRDLFKLYESSGSKFEGSTYTRDQLNSPILRPSSGAPAKWEQPVRYSEYPQTVNIKPVPKDVDDDENPVNNGQPVLVPSSQLDELNDLFAASQIVRLNPYLTSLSDSQVLSGLEDPVKMGLLFGRPGQMTSRDIIEYISNNFKGDQWILAQEMVQKIMDTETEYLRLSLQMMEMMLDHTDNFPLNKNSPKYSFDIAQLGSHSNFPRPGINDPARIDQISAPIIYLPNYTNHQLGSSASPSPHAQSLNSLGESSLSESTETSLFGLNEGLQPQSNVAPPSKPLREGPNLQSSPVRGESNPIGSIGPQSREGRMTLIDMFEEELHSAIGNFLFQEAWMTEMCMIPTHINEAVSELRFLSVFIQENFNIAAKGMLDIDKFAGRIISAIIRCHFQDPESALLDGRLTTAISGGIVAAEMLNSQIRIMKMMMQGWLDSEDAKNIISLLRWSVQPHGNVSAAEFLTNRDKNYLNYIKNTVQISLQEYVEFLRAKSSDKFNGNSIESQVKNSSLILNNTEPQNPVVGQTDVTSGASYSPFKPTDVLQGISKSDTRLELSHSLPAEESDSISSQAIFNNDNVESVGTYANITTESTTAVAFSVSEASVIGNNSYSDHTNNYINNYSSDYETPYKGTSEVSSIGSYASNNNPISLDHLVPENLDIIAVGPNSEYEDDGDYVPENYEYEYYEYGNENEKKDKWGNKYGYNSPYAGPHDKGYNAIKSSNSTSSVKNDPEYYKNKGVKNENQKTEEHFDYTTPADKDGFETKYDKESESNVTASNTNGNPYRILDDNEESSASSKDMDKEVDGNNTSEYDKTKDDHVLRGDSHSHIDDHTDKLKGEGSYENSQDDNLVEMSINDNDDQLSSRNDSHPENRELDSVIENSNEANSNEVTINGDDNEESSKNEPRPESLESPELDNIENSFEDNSVEVISSEDDNEVSSKNVSLSESLENRELDSTTTPVTNFGTNNFSESHDSVGNNLENSNPLIVDEDIVKENGDPNEYSPLHNVDLNIIFTNLNN